MFIIFESGYNSRKLNHCMENFIVSARKYRPATFDTVVGQESITSTLKNAIRNNQLAQAFLFCGPRGVGKTTCARILAKTINCFNPINQVEPCNECESCNSFNRSASFNIHELDAASNNSVDDIRNLVDQVRIPPQVGKYKVYIIDEVHMLSSSAFNAFLKTLEEPPHYAKFILATTEKHKIIPTILSRCQIFDFKRITVKDIADYLAFVAEKEGVTASEEALHLIAQKADGALRDALSFFDQLVSFSGKELRYETVIEHLNILDHTYYFRIIDQVLSADTSGVLLSINEIVDRGFDGQHFLIGLGDHIRSLLVSKDPATVKLMEVSASLQEKYLAQSVKCNPSFLLKALEIHNQCDINYRTSNNKKLLLELTLLQLCALIGSNAGEEQKISPIARPAENKSAGPEQKQSTETTPVPVKKETPSRPPASQPETGPPSTQRSRTISIKPENHAEKTKGNNGAEIAADFDHKDFTQEQLDKVWLYFRESIAPQYPNFYISLQEKKPLLKEGHVIELMLENKIQAVLVDEHRAELLDFLRQELQNFKISIETVISESAEETRPYTADEKYRAMVEKNPALKEIKDKLDLELEF